MKDTSICIVDETGKICFEGIEKTDPKLLADKIKGRHLKWKK